MVNFVVTKFSDITDIILPFFDKFEFKGFKRYNYTYFKQAVEVFRKKKHLTPSGLKLIREMKEKMNK